MFSHFTSRFAQLQVADNSSLVVSFSIPHINLAIMFVAAICHKMNIWEMTLAIGRHISPPKSSGDMTDGFYAIWTPFHVEKQLSTPVHTTPTRTEHHGQYCIDEIKFDANNDIDDAAQAKIDALCASTYYAPWDAGSPQPNSPDIEAQVRQILNDIDEYGESLPY
jgi:hypothetical protein